MENGHHSAPPVDAKTFWRTLGQRAIGMTIVTAADEHGPAGFLGLSAAHVSASPPTLLVSIDSKTSALTTVRASRHFAVNFIGSEAGSVADAFSGKSGLTGSDRFVEAEWTKLVTGAPVYRAALGAFDCIVDEIIERGSISIVIGTAVSAVSREDGSPLVFFRGGTTTF